MALITPFNFPLEIPVLQVGLVSLLIQVLLVSSFTGSGWAWLAHWVRGVAAQWRSCSPVALSAPLKSAPERPVLPGKCRTAAV